MFSRDNFLIAISHFGEEQALRIKEVLERSKEYDEMGDAVYPLLRDISDIIGGYGVEDVTFQGTSIVDSWAGSYVNMGDSYLPTIAYDRAEGGFVVCCMADILESWETYLREEEESKEIYVIFTPRGGFDFLSVIAWMRGTGPAFDGDSAHIEMCHVILGEGTHSWDLTEPAQSALGEWMFDGAHGKQGVYLYAPWETVFDAESVRPDNLYEHMAYNELPADLRLLAIRGFKALPEDCPAEDWSWWCDVCGSNSLSAANDEALWLVRGEEVLVCCHKCHEGNIND